MSEKIKKPTKKQMFNSLLEKYPLTEAEVAFIEHEIELLNRKNVSSTGEKKMTKEQMARAEIAEVVYAFLSADGGQFTCGELIKAIPELSEYSNQKAYAVVKHLLDENRVERIEDKRKVYWKAL